MAFVADGIVIYRLQCKADIKAFVVDGITTGSYLSLNSMLFIRTSFLIVVIPSTTVVITSATTYM